MSDDVETSTDQTPNTDQPVMKMFNMLDRDKNGRLTYEVRVVCELRDAAMDWSAYASMYEVCGLRLCAAAAGAGGGIDPSTYAFGSTITTIDVCVTIQELREGLLSMRGMHTIPPSKVNQIIRQIDKVRSVLGSIPMRAHINTYTPLSGTAQPPK